MMTSTVPSGLTGKFARSAAIFLEWPVGWCSADFPGLPAEAATVLNNRRAASRIRKAYKDQFPLSLIFPVVTVLNLILVFLLPLGRALSCPFRSSGAPHYGGKYACHVLPQVDAAYGYIRHG